MSSATSRSDRPSAAEIALRAVAATGGAYVVAYLFTAAVAGLCHRGFGMARVDAAILSSSMGLFVLPAVSIWAFAEKRLARVLIAPVAISAILAAMAWLLRP